MRPIQSACRRLWLATGACLALPATAQVTFPVSFDATAVGLTAPERDAITSHVQAAGQRWMSVLELAGPRSIEIQIGINDAFPTANGGSITSVFVATDGGRNRLEQSAAAELRSGIDPNGATADARITFNKNYLRNELWFDPAPVARSANVPNDRTDAMSVLMHELGHVLAYNGWANGQGVAPPTFWSTFDRWMMPGAPTLFAGPAVLVQFGGAPDLTTNNIHHWHNGPVVRKSQRAATPLQWRDGVPVPMPGCDGIPSADLPNSPRSTRAKGNPPAGLLGELMNGVAFYRGTRYEVSALDIAVLEDVGLPAQDFTVFENGFEGG